MKSTSIHFLPIELLAFLDIAPYLFINREDTSHTFWMATSATMNLLHTIDEALEDRNVRTLNKILNRLKMEPFAEVLLAASDDPTDEDLAEVDLFTLNDKRFQPVAACLLKEDESYLNKVIVCLKFHLKYKLVDFEETDDFQKKAEIVFQEPPVMVYSQVAGEWRVEYNQNLADIEVDETGVGKFYVKAYDANTCEIQIESDVSETDSQPQDLTTTSKAVKRPAEENKNETTKTAKVFTEAEINEANEAARILCEVSREDVNVIPGRPLPKFISTPKRPEGFQNCLPKGYLPLTPKSITKDDNNETGDSKAVNRSQSSCSRSEVEKLGTPIQLHFHLPAGVSQFTIINPAKEINEWKINLN